MAKLFYFAYWKSFSNFVLRALAVASSAAVIALFLTVNYKDLSFKGSPELLCAFVVSVVACGYSVAHVLFYALTNIVAFKFSKATFTFFHGLFFTADQLMAYALLGSAAAAVVTIKQIRDIIEGFGLNDTRTDKALIRLLIGVSLEFLAFAVLGLSSLMSGYYYMNLRMMGASL